MATINVTIKNLPEIKAAFNKAPRLMSKELNLAIRKTVLMIGSDSRRNTPVDTGRLRASTREFFQNLRGEIGTHTEYDIFVHEGTRFMKGRPYLKKAVEMNERKTDENFREAVQNVLNEIGRST